MSCFRGANALMTRSPTVPSLFSIILTLKMLVDAENPSLSHSIRTDHFTMHNRKYPHQPPLLSTFAYLPLFLPLYPYHTDYSTIADATRLDALRAPETLNLLWKSWVHISMHNITLVHFIVLVERKLYR